MFRKALIRMTLFYLLILMTISLFFSAALYQISAQEIQRGLNHQQGNFEKLGPFMRGFIDDPGLIQQREQDLADARARIFWQLVYTNLVIVLIGGGLSYLMALRTIKPIEEAHEAQARFTGDASHELRSPLASMKSEIEVALRDPKITRAELIDILKSNLEEVNRLSSLSTYLLELAQDENASLSREKTKLASLVDSAISVVEPQALESKVKIEAELNQEAEASVNAESVKELLVILLENAIKYRGDGEKVTVRLAKRGSGADISITDSGIGIKPEDIPYIFERFYRADSSRCKNEVEGYGLGLALAKKIADANRAEISVVSKVGEGSTFKVKFGV